MKITIVSHAAMLDGDSGGSSPGPNDRLRL